MDKSLNDKWYGQEVATSAEDSTLMVDSGTGKQLVIRCFEFAINPQKAKELREKKIKLDKQQLFNSHWQQIRTMLWGDGLVASTDVDPRIVVGKKKYRIFLLCEPKLRTMINDTPQTLQEVFKA